MLEEEGVDMLTILIKERKEGLTLVAPSPRGGPGETTTAPKRKIRSCPIPTISATTTSWTTLVRFHAPFHYMKCQPATDQRGRSARLLSCNSRRTSDASGAAGGDTTAAPSVSRWDRFPRREWQR